MRILRVVVMPLLFSACAVAQSAPAKVLLMQPPAVPSQTLPQVEGFQFSPVTPQVGLLGRSLPATIAVQPSVLVRPEIVVDNAVCYAMRSYAFARESAGSDTTRLTGSSTCRPSSQLKFKSAVQWKVIR